MFESTSPIVLHSSPPPSLLPLPHRTRMQSLKALPAPTSDGPRTYRNLAPAELDAIVLRECLAHNASHDRQYAPSTPSPLPSLPSLPLLSSPISYGAIVPNTRHTTRAWLPRATLPVPSHMPSRAPFPPLRSLVVRGGSSLNMNIPRALELFGTTTDSVDDKARLAGPWAWRGKGIHPNLGIIRHMDSAFMYSQQRDAKMSRSFHFALPLSKPSCGKLGSSTHNHSKERAPREHHAEVVEGERHPSKVAYQRW